MGLITETVWVGVNGKNKKYYKDLGYIIPDEKSKYGKIRTPRGIKIEVKVKDLPKSANIQVCYECDMCGKINYTPYQMYCRSKNTDNKHYCHTCAVNEYGGEISRITHLKKSISFNEYCKNNDVGFDIKLHWSDKNTINSCDISYCSNKTIYIVCPNCGHIIKTKPSIIHSYHLTCPNCSDGISYSEKFLFGMLNQLKDKNKINDFDWHKSFNWSKSTDNVNSRLNGRKIYDFYLTEFGGIIIELQGKQHYGNFFVNYNTHKTVDEEQENDIIKESLAKNKIAYYKKIDCKKSELEWIKNGILQSDLPQIINFTEQDIDWIKCEEYAIKNYIKQIYELWNNTHNINEISLQTKLHKETVKKYLKQGFIHGWCDYEAEKERKLSYKRMFANNYKSIKVICVTTKEIFISQSQAQRKRNATDISRCCQGKLKHSGKLPDGTQLQWMYLDEYMQQNGYTDPTQIPEVIIYESDKII